jgi:hypothetical protein
MRLVRIPLAVVLTVLVTVGMALAQDEITLSQGTQFSAVMDSPLDSATANVGDRFSMHVISPYPNYDPRFAGATITGSVLAVTRASRGVKPGLALAIDKLVLPDGTAVDLDAQVISEQSQAVHKSGANVALSTLGGMLFGNAVMQTIFHVGGGGLIGAVGGFIYGLNDKANMTVPAGAQVQLAVARDVVIRRQSPQ